MAENVRRSDEEMERAALGAAIIAGGESLQALLLHMQPEDLTSRERRSLLLVMADLASKGLDHADMVSIAHRGAEMAPDVDLMLEAVECSSATASTSPSSVEFWCKEIAKRAAIRDLQRTARRIQSDDMNEPEDILTEFSQAASNLRYADQSAGTTLKDLVPKEFKHVEDVKAGRVEIESIQTGLMAFDDGGGYFPGELWTIAAMPNAGKTALMLQVAHRTADRYGDVAIFSLEMTKEELVRRLWCQGSKELTPASLRTKTELSDRQWQELAHRSGRLSELPIRILDRAGVTVERICASARRIALSSKLRLICVDYLQIVKRSVGDGEAEHLSHITRSLKELAKELGCVVLLLSQVTKEGQKRGGGELQLADMRGSSGAADDSDGVVFLWRPHLIDMGHDPAQTFMDRKKARNGRLGRFEATFDGARFTFRDAEAIPF